MSDIRSLNFQGFESPAPSMFSGEEDFRSLVNKSGLELAAIFIGGSFILREKSLSRISYICLKDMWEEDQSVELGHGKIDSKAVLAILRQNTYDGWLTIRLDETNTTPKESAQVSLRLLEKQGIIN